MADYAILATEVLTDPYGRGYSTMSDQEVADDINTYLCIVSKIVLVGEVRSYLSTQISGTGANQRSTLALLQEFADKGTVRGTAPSVTALEARRSAAEMIVFMLRYGGDGEGFLVTNANIQSLFTSIGPDGGNGPSVLTNSQLTAIAALATEQLLNRIRLRWGKEYVDADDVKRVRA